MRGLIGLIALAIVCAAPLAAHGQAADMQVACAYDVPKFCGDVKAGGGRVQHCLRQHASKLSPNCKALIARANQGGGVGRARVAPWAAACQEDVAKLCQGVQAGQGRVRACLKADASKLSTGCKAALEAKPAAAATPAAAKPTAAAK